VYATVEVEVDDTLPFVELKKDEHLAWEN